MSSDSNNWIDDAISKMHIKYFDYKHFRNVEEIGNGGFGKIYCANWKNSEQRLVLKSLINLNPIAIKELTHELKLHRDVDFNDNIIHFCGITQENPNDKLKKYLLVMEYADGGTLQDYLVKNFYNLSWIDKYNLAFQLANAVLCLHDEGIIHCDLHSGNVLIRNGIVKLADFGLSRRIDDASQYPSRLFGVIPYIDPKKFGLNNVTRKPYKLNEKSDVYGVGILLWVISSGQQPFNGSNNYGLDLVLEISKGLRETPIHNTPEEYIKIYTECWVDAPEKRPTMQQVVAKLKTMISKTNVTPESTPLDSPTHGDLSSLINNFENMDFESNISSTNITTIEKVVRVLSTINDADDVMKISVPYPPQITAEEVLNRSKAKERKKAPNSFMIYRMAYIKELKTKNLNINQFNASVLAASKWNNESEEIKKDRIKEAIDELKKLMRTIELEMKDRQKILGKGKELTIIIINEKSKPWKEK
ncbi:kinase-like protein [Rhizophagus irregularis]|uniref:Kinase-like protein n=1 Tax=Rhizophagus irregularis TaxID=588596 RepID=A0A2I1H0E6_9GLOM|nr:kinase-like protein [Rhizophagus irregularis]